MKAAVVQVLGQPPKYQEFAEPAPGANEILIQVHAAGLHPIVKAIASGAHYSADGQVPMVPGLDGVGTRPDGMRVYFGSARKPWGTMAERCAAPASMCLPLPDGISDVEAAAIANPGMSAWLSLRDRGELKPGETALILGATGVAGQLAIQAAHLLGAKRVIAVGRNVDAIAKENVDAIIALGQPEDAVREALVAEATKGIDVVIDYLWGRPTELLLDALAKTFKPARRDLPDSWRWAKAPDRPLHFQVPCSAAWTSSCLAAGLAPCRSTRSSQRFQSCSRWRLRASSMWT